MKILNSNRATMPKCFLLFVLLFSFCVGFAQPTLSLDWMKTEPDGRANLVKKDSQGNIVVLANSGGSVYNYITTIKYDKNGNQLWKRIYTDTLNEYPDLGSAIELDSLDNIYVGGTVNFDGSGSSFNGRSILLKYDSQGNVKWKREYGSNIGMDGGAIALKIYQNKYIYLAGYMDSASGNGFTKSFLALYDSSGLLNWTFIDSSTFETYSQDVVIDKIGNAYLTGVTACCLPGYNIYSTKFNLTGNIRWSNIITDVTHPYATARTSIIDDSANVLICGETQGFLAPTGFDAYIVKIDSSGNQKWTKSFYKDSTTSQRESSNGILFDAFQDLYLFGNTIIANFGQSFIAKIDKYTGNKKWIRWYNGYGFSRGLSSKDSTLVFTGIDSVNNLVLFAFDTSGAIKWSYNNFCQCFGNDIVESDSSFFLAGDNYQPFSSSLDSIMVCSISADFTSNVTEEKQIVSNLLIFPNPFISEFQILFANNPFHNATVKIYNTLGIVLYEGDFLNYHKVETEKWNADIYFIEIKHDSVIERKKIIKQ